MPKNTIKERNIMKKQRNHRAQGETKKRTWVSA